MLYMLNHGLLHWLNQMLNNQKLTLVNNEWCMLQQIGL